ncbi:MAG: CpsB/CapC family capsule biosynthesis tyrosine phosphatase [Clostridia bacterium]
MEMIDMHCHILPGIDDGPVSIRTSFNMAKKAYECGYTAIFATPHYIDKEIETSRVQIENLASELNDLLKQSKLGIKIYTGNEVYLSAEVLECIYNKNLCTLGNSRYVLIELPMQGKIIQLNSIISEIISKGFIPIIAHPERYDFVTKNYKELLPLIDMGAILQINIGSIVGLYGTSPKKNVISLLKNNLVHLVGTDAHDSKRVYDIYRSAIKKIERILTDKKIEEIFFKNPQAVKADRKI